VWWKSLWCIHREFSYESIGNEFWKSVHNVAKYQGAYFFEAQCSITLMDSEFRRTFSNRERPVVWSIFRCVYSGVLFGCSSPKQCQSVQYGTVLKQMFRPTVSVRCCRCERHRKFRTISTCESAATTKERRNVTGRRTCKQSALKNSKHRRPASSWSRC